MSHFTTINTQSKTPKCYGWRVNIFSILKLSTPGHRDHSTRNLSEIGTLHQLLPHPSALIGQIVKGFQADRQSSTCRSLIRSRNSRTIEAMKEIRGQGICEVQGTTSEGVGSQRYPDLKIGAGKDDSAGTFRAGESEAKLLGGVNAVRSEESKWRRKIGPRYVGGRLVAGC